MDLECMGEAALASRTVLAQGPGWLISRKVSKALFPVFLNCFSPAIHLVLLSSVGCCYSLAVAGNKRATRMLCCPFTH